MARILHVIESLDASLGGPPAVCLRLAAAQAGRGHQVGILCRSSDAAGFPADRLESIPGGDAVAGFTVPMRGGRVARALAAEVGAFVESRRASWDFLHIHSVWDPATRSAGHAALRAGIPYVLTTHGMLDRWGMRQGIVRPIKKRIALRLAIGRVLRGASFLHALTLGEQDGIRAYGYGARTAVVPNGMFLEEIPQRSDVAALHRSHPALGEAPFALFLGRLHPVKGIDRLLAGFRGVVDRMPEARLVIAGPDYGQERALQSQITSLGLDRNVTFLGPVFGPARFDLMRECRVFCQMSRYEGFSVALLEALACGCPVIASVECRFPEIAAEGAGRIIAAEPALIAESMLAFLRDASARQAASIAGRELVRRGFTWAEVGRRMDEAYRAFHLTGMGA